MADRGNTRGKVVVDGVLRYLSPSGITTGDPSQFAGCQRRWHFKYVAGKKEPETAAQKAGTDTHAQIEHYLRTGEMVLGQTALAGREWIPKPDPAYLIEHDMGGVITAAGVPVIGYIDLVRPHAEHTDEHGERDIDPDGTIEVVDWKTTGNLSNGKKSHELLETVQMATYGAWALEHYAARHVRLSHVYFRTKDRPQARKATKLHSAEQIAKRWEGVEAAARSLVQIARVKPEHSNQVDANTAACNAYGGCPHRSYCKGAGESSLEQLLGASTAKSLLGGKEEMSLLAKIAPPPVPAPVQTLDLKAEMEKLAAEVVAAARPTVPAGFAEAWARVEAHGKGFPALIGKVAEARCIMLGHELKGEGLAGSGYLGGLTLSEPEALTQLADELGPVTQAITPSTNEVAQVTQSAPVAAITPAGVGSLLPGDAPESKPELAAKPVEGFEGPVGLATGGIAPSVAEAPKRGRGRPRKTESPVATAATPRTTEAPAFDNSDGLALFVDCVTSMPCENLAAYVDEKATRLAAQFDAADIRCAPSDSPLGFGKWKGALAALVREEPPAPGAYVLFTHSEIHEVVADALRGKASLYVRGVK